MMPVNYHLWDRQVCRVALTSSSFNSWHSLHQSFLLIFNKVIHRFVSIQCLLLTIQCLKILIQFGFVFVDLIFSEQLHWCWANFRLGIGRRRIITWSRLQSSYTLKSSYTLQMSRVKILCHYWTRWYNIQIHLSTRNSSGVHKNLLIKKWSIVKLIEISDILMVQTSGVPLFLL